MPIEELPPRPCVGSGLCCKKVPCAYGEWNSDRTQCAHLLVDRTLPNGAEIHACGKYEAIMKEPGAEWYPAFGAGCCMAMFNHLREAVLAGLREERDG